ncbi:MAG TPA: hypothetical protein ENN33_16195 [Ignavibacteria bacterium]|nr:hypothetical protein [Ignavibacteria bacterium]
MLNFQDLNLSAIKQHNRIEVAKSALGEQTVNRILAFSSYLMGAPRKEIAEAFNYSVPGLASMVQRIQQEGTCAFSYNQGPRTQGVLKPVKPKAMVSSTIKDFIESNIDANILNIRINNPLEMKISFNPEHTADQIFILKCQEAGIITIQQAANFLQKTSNQIQTMIRKLKQTGGIEAVQDQRQGQKQAYKFSDEAKSNLFYYFFEDLITHRSISSIRIHDKLSQDLKIGISDRMVRNYLENIGLSAIKVRLIELAKKKISVS